jgi:hypothetical protein
MGYPCYAADNPNVAVIRPITIRSLSTAVAAPNAIGTCRFATEREEKRDLDAGKTARLSVSV